uniref:Uncharacterized protein n=1 Tax=Nelumbo nucifera TaxID=4432 RepID=A0A822XJN6_NELNU|nr:TPA_asm: hypothetical protein HUJ06_021386 [Nelumbo nucifera]
MDKIKAIHFNSQKKNNLWRGVLSCRSILHQISQVAQESTFQETSLANILLWICCVNCIQEIDFSPRTMTVGLAEAGVWTGALIQLSEVSTKLGSPHQYYWSGTFLQYENKHENEVHLFVYIKLIRLPR